MPTNWTDNPITTSTPIKAIHINELRNAIDAGLDDAGLKHYNWTGTVTAGATPILAQQIVELRSATQNLWSAKRLGLLPNWSGTTHPARGTRIRASHINDLRSWVNAFENSANRPADPQGVVSFAFKPETIEEGILDPALEAISGYRLARRACRMMKIMDGAMGRG